MKKITYEKYVNRGYQKSVVLGSDFWQGQGHGITSGVPILFPDRDTRPYLSPFEPQRRNAESSACTQYAKIGSVETLIKRKEGIIIDYSERALAILSNNSVYGNDPNVTAQTLRRYGLVKEEVLPFTDDIQSWEQYINPAPLTKNDLIKKGKKWGYDFKYERVKPDPEKMWHSLQFSRLDVAVLAWRKEGEFYVKEKGENDNHLTGIAFAEYKKYWLVDDSYLDNGERFKKLPWDYPFDYVSVCGLSRKQLSWPWCWKFFQ